MQAKDKNTKVKFRFKYIPITIFVIINLIAILAMWFCAYTCTLHPTYHPNVSYFGLLFPAFLLVNVLFVFFWLVFKWKLTCIPLLGMLLCWGSIRTYCPINFKKDIPEGCIKVMSYNVMYFGGAQNDDAITDENAVINYILNSGADIVCVQEGVVSGRPKVKEMLSGTYPYIQEGVEHAHINVCFSKYPILDTEVIHYESQTNRSFAYKILVKNDTLLVVNNHFESYHLHAEEKTEYKDIIKHPRNKENVNKYNRLTVILSAVNSIRGLQVDRVVEYVDSVPCKYKILCGDFNDSSLSYTHYRLTQNYKDAYTESGFGPGITFHDSGMYFRIDNILVSKNITSYQTKVDNSISESDHYPIVSHLFLNEN